MKAFLALSAIILLFGGVAKAVDIPADVPGFAPYCRPDPNKPAPAEPAPKMACGSSSDSGSNSGAGARNRPKEGLAALANLPDEKPCYYNAPEGTPHSECRSDVPCTLGKVLPKSGQTTFCIRFPDRNARGLGNTNANAYVNFAFKGLPGHCGWNGACCTFVTSKEKCRPAVVHPTWFPLTSGSCSDPANIATAQQVAFILETKNGAANGSKICVKMEDGEFFETTLEGLSGACFGDCCEGTPAGVDPCKLFYPGKN